SSEHPRSGVPCESARLRLRSETAACSHADRDGGNDHQTLSFLSPCNVERSCSRFCARYRTLGTEPPSSPLPATGPQSACALPLWNTPATAFCVSRKSRKVLPMCPEWSVTDVPVSSLCQRASAPSRSRAERRQL